MKKVFSLAAFIGAVAVFVYGAAFLARGTFFAVSAGLVLMAAGLALLYASIRAGVVVTPTGGKKGAVAIEKDNVAYA